MSTLPNEMMKCWEIQFHKGDYRFDGVNDHCRNPRTECARCSRWLVRQEKNNPHPNDSWHPCKYIVYNSLFQHAHPPKSSTSIYLSVLFFFQKSHFYIMRSTTFSMLY